MLKLIEGLPPNVLGIEAAGEVTHDDYRKVLTPAAEAKIARGSVRMRYVAGPDFTGYELEALWDDAAFGFKHWHQFNAMECMWLRSAIAMFHPFFPREIRLFKFTELTAAKHWITHVERVSA